MFNGAMLLGMKQDDIRAICPEEGGRVFFQLQSVRSTVAVSHAALFVQSKLPPCTNSVIYGALFIVMK